MNNVKAGNIVTLVVERESDFGFFLSDGETSILLHNSEITSDIQLQQEVEVFLYSDHQGRIAATTTLPSITSESYGWVKVVEVKQNLGAFIDIGIKKDILVSGDDLPLLENIWPEIGDQLYCSLKTDNRGRLLAKLATEEIVAEIMNTAPKELSNRNIKGTIYRSLKVGSFLLTDEGYRGFIHHSERKSEPRLGESVEGRVIAVKDDGTINVSLLSRSHESMDDDSVAICKYMDDRGGAMPYSDKSAPEDIKQRFHMSKGAFKRALGKLMKEDKVYQEDGWTYFKK
ncbi:S1 RNA-binding domain-containing protein [Cytobacillus sp. IB215665]|uniref:CvfB family protein n=1 Tax=Cytobacillus sp. IB215665 TaxID=3097357 RepID=UPI002A1745C9|nr:S1-like domain-containing RNA-binding protein [Cytobacillus sp. IB215665]MDX8364524.1 S1-like domain-containing RNA-binding protein [Cytobacillus sp. IB215665]